jgi:hypothetical protein
VKSAEGGTAKLYFTGRTFSFSSPNVNEKIFFGKGKEEEKKKNTKEGERKRFFKNQKGDASQMVGELGFFIISWLKEGDSSIIVLRITNIYIII